MPDVDIIAKRQPVQFDKLINVLKGVLFLDQKLREKQFITFNLAGNEYGIDIQEVMEITVMMPITIVPKTPGYIMGVINLRSDVVPVVSLMNRLGLGEYNYTEDTRIIIVVHDDIRFGVVVDSVKEVLSINEENIENITATDENQSDECIYGVGKLGERIIALLDVERIINLKTGG